MAPGLSKVTGTAAAVQDPGTMVPLGPESLDLGPKEGCQGLSMV